MSRRQRDRNEYRCLLLTCLVLVMAVRWTRSARGQQTATGRVLPAVARTGFQAGVGRVDITPGDEITLAGSPSPQKTATVDTPLYVTAMVVSLGDQQLAIVTMDTLKYPAELAARARQHVEQRMGIPARHVIISASHTHYGPLWSYYKDRLITAIGKAVALAVDDLTPCRLGIATVHVKGVSQNRRILINGQCWNTWLVDPQDRKKYPAAGPVDSRCNLLAVMDSDGHYKAVLYSFGCHPASTGRAVISADYPGHVRRCLAQRLGYEVPTLFLLGPCGDVNASNSAAFVGRKIAEQILSGLGDLRYVDQPELRIADRSVELPGRANPQFDEQAVSLKWNAQVEHYRSAFARMQQRAKPAYRAQITCIRAGNDFALVTDPVELFCEVGVQIKAASPFKHTVVATLTNGAFGYVPTAPDFEVGGYETWYGEHSFLAIQAAAVIERESVEMLRQVAGQAK